MGKWNKRITDACKNYGTPIPEIVNEAGEVAVKYKPSENYLKAMKVLPKMLLQMLLQN